MTKPRIVNQHDADYHEPTEAELDQMIAEQLPTMPKGDEDYPHEEYVRKVVKLLGWRRRYRLGDA